jgi:hypothetical protein
VAAAHGGGRDRGGVKHTVRNCGTVCPQSRPESPCAPSVCPPEALRPRFETGTGTGHGGGGTGFPGAGFERGDRQEEEDEGPPQSASGT